MDQDTSHNEVTAALSTSTIFESLDTNTPCLLKVLLFFNPVSIPLALFEVSNRSNFSWELGFWRNKSSTMKALGALFNLAFIRKQTDSHTITIDKDIHHELKNGLSYEDRQLSFKNASIILYDVWAQQRLEGLWLYEEWESCPYTAHALDLRDYFFANLMGSRIFKPPREFCELLRFYQQHLSKCNDMKELAMTCGINRQALAMADYGKELMDVDVLISVHQAQAAESLGEPLKAIELNKQAYSMQINENPQQLIELCYTANNLGYSHTIARLYEKAQEWFDISEKWWHLAVKSGDESGERPVRHIMAHARCFMGLHNYAKVEDMLGICISRLKTEYPLDWAMLAHVLFAQANLWSHRGQCAIAMGLEIKGHNAWMNR